MLYNFVVGVDYISLAGINTFNLDGSNSVFTVDIPLNNDNVYELTETFFSNLAFQLPPPERVTINPDRAETTILDDDSKSLILLHVLLGGGILHLEDLYKRPK